MLDNINDPNTCKGMIFECITNRNDSIEGLKQMIYLEENGHSPQGIQVILKNDLAIELFNSLDCEDDLNLGIFMFAQRIGVAFNLFLGVQNCFWGLVYSIEKEGQSRHIHLWLMFNPLFNYNNALEAMQVRRETEEKRTRIQNPISYFKTLINAKCEILKNAKHARNFPIDIKDRKNASMIEYILKNPVHCAFIIFRDSIRIARPDQWTIHGVSSVEKLGRVQFTPFNEFVSCKEMFDAIGAVAQQISRNHKIQKKPRELISALSVKAKIRGVRLSYQDFTQQIINDSDGVPQKMYYEWYCLCTPGLKEEEQTPDDQLKKLFDNELDITTTEGEENVQAGELYKEKIKGYLVNEFRGISIWIKNYFLRRSKFNKMLVLYGESRVGKSFFQKVFFPSYIFGQVGLSLSKGNFSDANAYNPETCLWIYSDINEGLTKENLFYLQNLINSDRCLEAKFKNIDTSVQSRPIIAATTVDLPLKLQQVTEKDKGHLDVVKQFTSRIITINLTDPKRIKQFAVLTWKFGIPPRLKCLMFWRAYFEIEDQIELVDESKVLRLELLDSSFEEENNLLPLLSPIKQPTEEQVAEKPEIEKNAKNEDFIEEDSVFDLDKLLREK